MSGVVLTGDCREMMRTLAANSVDAIVTDPPYGLAFMGKGWDHAVPGVDFWTEALRVAKPGAHLLAFGGTRTYHRLACAIEDAGWEIRDCLSWLYGSGFPKSHDVSKALDKAAGAEREVVGEKVTGAAYTTHDGNKFNVGQKLVAVTAPASPAAEQWQGWGTALKPAWEPIIMARKPLVGTVAANVAAHGTGGINVDGCRIVGSRGAGGQHGAYSPIAASSYDHIGRWPANVALDEDAAAQLGEPSRFFYVAKAARREREAGLEGMPVRIGRTAYDPEYHEGGGKSSRVAHNHHPTVKPIALMRWLCRLVTPAGGIVLDPFTGSGTTGCAAALEGFRFIGCEQNEEYADIARARLAHWEASV